MLLSVLTIKIIIIQTKSGYFKMRTKFSHHNKKHIKHIYYGQQYEIEIWTPL